MSWKVSATKDQSDPSSYTTAPNRPVTNNEVVAYRFGTGDTRDVGTYDSMRYSGSIGRYKQKTMGTVYKGLLGPVKDMFVLDVACGTGRGALDFVSDASCVIACDASPDMLSVARAKSVNETKIAFTCGLAQAIPFGDGLFDIVTCLNFLHLFRPSSQLVFVEEMVRVLRPGGKLLLEFDNALHAFGLGLVRRLLGGERGSLPSEIRAAIPNHARIIKTHGALIPYFWRWLGKYPLLSNCLDRFAALPLIHRLLCLRIYVIVEKTRETQ